MIRYYLIRIVRLLSKILCILPIKNNRILFYSFSGKGFSDSPKYICDYIVSHSDEYEIIWAVNNPEECSFLKDRGWKVIGYKSWRHFVYGLTSKFIVTNTGPYAALEYRKSQVIINTWHGGGAYKKTGVDNPYKNKWQILYNKNFGQAGVKLFLSSSEAFTKYAIRGAFEYKGEVLQCGLPRNDILLDKSKHGEIRKKVKLKLGIKDNERFILYAPTWRNYDTSKSEKLSVNDLVKTCESKFGSTWRFVFRGHNLSKGLESESDEFINATNYPDMQELMIAADMLISDYSSCIWDYSLMLKPCFLFVPDLEQYDGTFAFYEPIDTWGFDVCKSNDTLNERIFNYNEESYVNNVHNNHVRFGKTETGKACHMIYEWIKESI